MSDGTDQIGDMWNSELQDQSSTEEPKHDKGSAQERESRQKD
jgi:hypothetical protein